MPFDGQRFYMMFVNMAKYIVSVKHYSKDFTKANASIDNFIAFKDIKENKEIKEEKTMKKTLTIKGMMCMHCVAHAKKALEAVDGVSEAIVTLETDSAEVTLTKDVPNEALVKAIVDAGYTAEVK